MQYIVDRKNKEIAQLTVDLRVSRDELKMFRELRIADLQVIQDLVAKRNEEAQRVKRMMNRHYLVASAAILLALGIGIALGLFL